MFLQSKQIFLEASARLDWVWRRYIEMNLGRGISSFKARINRKNTLSTHCPEASWRSHAGPEHRHNTSCLFPVSCPRTITFHHQIEADKARDEGTIVYAVGVGSVPEETLEAIGGGPENVFDTSDFEGLDGEPMEIRRLK